MLLQLFKSSFDPLMTSECFEICPHNENSGNKNPINETELETEPKHRDEQAEKSNLGTKTLSKTKQNKKRRGRGRGRGRGYREFIPGHTTSNLFKKDQRQERDAFPRERIITKIKSFRRDTMTCESRNTNIP